MSLLRKKNVWVHYRQTFRFAVKFLVPEIQLKRKMSVTIVLTDKTLMKYYYLPYLKDFRSTLTKLLVTR